MQSNIKKLRKERHISQAELGEVLGKTQQIVSRMEHNRDCISIQSLIKLEEYFGVSADEILGTVPCNSELKDEDPVRIQAEGLLDLIRSDSREQLDGLILALLMDSLRTA